jgi:hypothetical protein
VYRFRAMRPPFAGRNPNSRSDLVYRGQVSTLLQLADALGVFVGQLFEKPSRGKGGKSGGTQ